MKKFLSLLILFVYVFPVLAYTQSDIDNATFLANENIIVKQSSASGYRLDDTITRAEVMGIALKMKGIVLPNYQCKGYYTDVRSNGWICRAVELAADEGIITRANAKARPQDSITRAEALAIMMKAGGVNINSGSGVSEGFGYFDENGKYAEHWQLDVMETARVLGIIYPVKIDVPAKEYVSYGLAFRYYWKHNNPATRAEVFAFAKEVLSHTNTVSLDQFGLQLAKDVFFEVDSTYASNGIYTLFFGSLREVCTNGCRQEYPQLYIRERKMSVTNELVEVLYGEFGGIKNIDGVMYLHYVTQDMCEGNNYVAFSDKYIFSFTYICGEDTFLDDASILEFTARTHEFNYRDVLGVYYGLLNNAEEGTTYLRNQAYLAYQMRAPAGVSEETFHAWYKNVTSVVLREDTIKDLGDNTYEFLIDMTENGIKSTYKVKSKVDLANFKIDNISSVKQ